MKQYSQSEVEDMVKHAFNQAQMATLKNALRTVKPKNRLNYLAIADAMGEARKQFNIILNGDIND